MMSSFCSLPGSPLRRAAPPCAGVARVGLPAPAADEDAGGTFTTPGYPQRNAAAATANRHSTRRRARRSGDAGGRPRATAPTGASATARHRPRPGDAFPRRVEPAPPPKPSEFQRFVEGATGRLLPIFGSSFFADAADTFQSLDNVPVSADYTSARATRSSLRAWGSIDVDYRSTVDRNGMLNLPKVGSFNVAGVQGGGPRAPPARADRAPVHQLRLSRLARPAARPARVRRRPGAAARRLHAVEPVDAAVGGRRGRRAEPDRLDAQDPAAPRRQGHLRARRLRVPGPGRQVERRAARRRRRRRVPAGRAARRRSPARSTRRRSTS